MRKLVVGALASAALALTCAAVTAQQFPEKPIRVVVGFPPGGPTDAAARIIGEEVTRTLGQTLVIENRPGGGGLIAAEQVRRSAPDGYTLLFAGTEMTALVQERRVRDLEPITPVATIPYVLVARPDSKYRSLQELLSQSQKQGVASVGHYAVLLARKLESDTKGRLSASVQRTFSDVTNALVSGRTELALLPHAAARSLLQEQKARGLAKFHVPPGQLPQVPDAREAGLPPVPEAVVGVFAPQGTPRPILSTLNRAFNAALKSPAVLKRFTDLGIVPRGGEPQALLKAVLELAAAIPDVCKIKNECEKDDDCPKPCPTS